MQARGYVLDAERTFLGPDGKPYPKGVGENLDKLFTECIQGSPPRASHSPPDTLNESSAPPSSFDGDTSVEQSSMCDISGVTGLNDNSVSSTDWDGPGPQPINELVEVFLSKMLNKSQIVNISSSADGSVLDDGKGQACDLASMEA